MQGGPILNERMMMKCLPDPFRDMCDDVDDTITAVKASTACARFPSKSAGLTAAAWQQRAKKSDDNRCTKSCAKKIQNHGSEKQGCTYPVSFADFPFRFVFLGGSVV